MRDCTAPHEAASSPTDENLPSAIAPENLEKAKSQPEMSQDASEQQMTRVQTPTQPPDLLSPPSSVAPVGDDIPFDVAAAAGLLGFSTPSDEHSLGPTPVRPAQSILGDSSKRPDATATGRNHNAPCRDDDEQWDFTAALARLAEPVVEQEERVKVERWTFVQALFSSILRLFDIDSLRNTNDSPYTSFFCLRMARYVLDMDAEGRHMCRLLDDLQAPWHNCFCAVAIVLACALDKAMAMSHGQ